MTRSSDYGVHVSELRKRADETGPHPGDDLAAHAIRQQTQAQLMIGAAIAERLEHLVAELGSMGLYASRMVRK